MEQIVFIGGMGRSGNNMLRNVLDSHSAITAGPEMNIIDDSMALYSLLSSSTERDGASRISEEEVRKTIAGFMSSMYEPYASRKGKRIVVDRHPDSIWSFPRFFRTQNSFTLSAMAGTSHVHIVTSAFALRAAELPLT